MWLHAVLLAVIPLFYLYRFLIGQVPSSLLGCMMHDFLFLYCPLCGGTRAIDAMLHLDVLGALRLNAFVVGLTVWLLILDVLAWVRYFRKQPIFYPLRRWVWGLVVALFLLFGIGRNYLMIAHGIDPMGDLVPLWNALLR